MKLINLVRGFWYSLLGMNCPDCGARPQQEHQPDCPTGEWDGGVWA